MTTNPSTNLDDIIINIESLQVQLTHLAAVAKAARPETWIYCRFGSLNKNLLELMRSVKSHNINSQILSLAAAFLVL